MKLGNRILLLVSERIGDVIFCTPAIQLLYTQLPTAKISVITSSHAAASVLAYNPAINAIYINPKKKQCQQLTQEHDVIINLHNNKITRKYSSELKLPTFVSPRGRTGHHHSFTFTEFVASLLECPLPASNHYLLYPQPQHFQTIEQLLITRQVDLKQDVLIGCHVGSNRIARRSPLKFWKKTDGHKTWSITNFIRLEKMLRQTNPRIRLILTGSPSETTLCQQLIKHTDRAVDLSGKTSVLDLAALMRYCQAFLTGDTGPLHVACSTPAPIPIVSLFGPTSADETGPYPRQNNHYVIQQAHLNDITVEKVYTTLLTALA